MLVEEKYRMCGILYCNHHRSATERQNVCNGMPYNRRKDSNHSHHCSKNSTLKHECYLLFEKEILWEIEKSTLTIFILHRIHNSHHLRFFARHKSIIGFGRGLFRVVRRHFRFQVSNNKIIKILVGGICQI